MALEELSFESINGQTTRQTDRQTDDRQKVITIAHPEHSSGELKTDRKCETIISYDRKVTLNIYRVAGR